MKCIILAHGEYGDLESYQALLESADLIICADGGANYALQLGVIPAYIIGDMDSIISGVYEYFLSQGAVFKKYPRAKDYTDTQLAISLAGELGADEVVLIGTLGGRLDLTLSNLYAGLELVERGLKLSHYTPDCTIHLVKGSLKLTGERGDRVSVMALTDLARGVNETGFEYPLDKVTLEKRNPYAVSNILLSSSGEIRVEEGVLLVFHYRQ